jgi:hypothetical protein
MFTHTGPWGELLTQNIKLERPAETVKFEQRILQRCCRQQNFWRMADGILNRVRNPICRLVNISQTVRLIHDDQIPIHLFDINVLSAGEVIRADDNFVLDERIEISLLDDLLERAIFQYQRRQEKLIGKFLIPLLAERGRNDD